MEINKAKASSSPNFSLKTDLCCFSALHDLLSFPKFAVLDAIMM